jgi:MoxR-like ATPase
MKALPDDVREAVRLLRSEVLSPVAERFAGREEIIELIALALSASENLLIVGPPGTAKSRIISEIGGRITGRRFECLLTRFTEPSEVFGPVDLKELREGRVVTRTEGMLPDAEIVFLDEVFNAGSAILNSLLGIINDGVFRRGSEIRRTDIISIIGATNRIPEDAALRALEDRFTLRVEARSMDSDGIDALLERGWVIERERLLREERTAPGRFDTNRLRRIHAALPAVDLAPVRERLAEAVKRIRAAGVFLSDRRAVKLQGLVAASAVLCGRIAADPSDLWPIRHVWETPDDAQLLGDIAADGARPGGSGEDSRAGLEIHPLAAATRRPADLLARTLRIEADLKRLRRDGRTLDDGILHRIQDIDAERRSCRPRNPKEESELRELEERLGSIADSLARKRD